MRPTRRRQAGGLSVWRDFLFTMHDQRHTLTRGAAAAVLWATGCLGPAWAAGAPPARPNIILILADDLGYGDLGAFGQRTIRTPNLDRMARDGMTFTQFYPGAAVCAPTRSVLMTGLHTGHARVRDNFSQSHGGRVPLEPEDVTIAEVLQQAGYATALVGKWGLGEPGTSGEPRRQGFDFFYGFLNQREAHTHYPVKLWRNENEEPVPGNEGNQRHTFAGDRFTEEAIAFVEQSRGRPFFLYLAYTAPHLEWVPPPDSLADYRGRIPEDEPFLAHRRYYAQPTPRAAYAALITRMDRDIGRLLDRLRELGLAENTLVVFTSDNGAHDTAGVADFFRSNGGLRGYKNELYEGGIRTPMIARWPAVTAPGTVVSAPVAGWDLMATFVDAAGARAPAGTDGMSIVPALAGGALPARDSLYWETPVGGFWQAVRFGQFKAIRAGMGKPLEVYDLSIDASERNNIAPRRPDLVARAETAFSAQRTESPHWPLPRAAGN